MTDSDEGTLRDSPIPSKRRVLIAGSIVLLTGAVAGTAYLSSVKPAFACDSPPCPSPAPAPGPISPK